MSRTGRGFGTGGAPISLRVPVTPMVRKIMATLVMVYLGSVVLASVMPRETFLTFWSTVALDHAAVFESGQIWTLFTYGWLHQLGSAPMLSTLVCALAAWGIVKLYRSAWAQQEFFLFVVVVIAATMLLGGLGFGAPLHVVGNLVGLYFFGHLFEDRWGPRRFLFFWTLCLVGGGVLSSLAWLLFPNLAGIGVVGASAGTMGLLAAYAVYFPDQTVLYGLVVPIKGKYFLYVAVIFDVVGLISGNGVAVFAHFGGIGAALLLCTGFWRPSKLKKVLDDRLGKKRRPKLRVVRDEDDDEPPRYLH